MHDLPHADNLLESARTSLLNELLPHLPAAQKYNALMIANALAIASREQNAESSAVQARRRLHQCAPGCTEIISQDLGIRDRQLCADLRSGALDADLLAIIPSLRIDVVCRLQVSNPKYLQHAEAFVARHAGEKSCAN